MIFYRQFDFRMDAANPWCFPWTITRILKPETPQTALKWV